MEHSFNEQREQPVVNLEVIFSRDTEVKRIQSTVEKLDWFRAQKYRINLPDKVNAIIDRGLVPTHDELEEIVSGEFNKDQYEQKAQELKREWDERGAEFIKKLSTLGLSLQTEYRVMFTKYGVGGSYGLPNTIQINFDYQLAKEPIAITLHEIIHLTIEELIKKYKIGHWEKERLVDLIYGRFYPDEKKLQRDPERAKEIEEAFNLFFPDIEKVIAEVGNHAEVPK